LSTGRAHPPVQALSTLAARHAARGGALGPQNPPCYGQVPQHPLLCATLWTSRPRTHEPRGTRPSCPHLLWTAVDEQRVEVDGLGHGGGATVNATRPSTSHGGCPRRRPPLVHSPDRRGDLHGPCDIHRIHSSYNYDEIPRTPIRPRVRPERHDRCSLPGVHRNRYRHVEACTSVITPACVGVAPSAPGPADGDPGVHEQARRPRAGRRW